MTREGREETLRAERQKQTLAAVRSGEFAAAWRDHTDAEKSEKFDVLKIL